MAAARDTNSWKGDVFIVIPAYNEEKTVGGVVKGLKAAGFDNVLVVDDGSRDNTAGVARAAGAITVNHVINRGLGGALGTGIQAALRLNAKYIVTCDADGQHACEDVEKVALALKEGGTDAAIGSRMLMPKGMPLHRKIGNFGLNVATFLLFGVWVTDSQSGLRGFTRDAAAKLRLDANRMEVSSEIIYEIRRNRLRLKEVPVQAIYTGYSLTHGQSSLNGFNILFKLFIKKLLR